MSSSFAPHSRTDLESEGHFCVEAISTSTGRRDCVESLYPRRHRRDTDSSFDETSTQVPKNAPGTAPSDACANIALVDLACREHPNRSATCKRGEMIAAHAVVLALFGPRGMNLCSGAGSTRRACIWMMLASRRTSPSATRSETRTTATGSRLLRRPRDERARASRRRSSKGREGRLARRRRRAARRGSGI